jgi:hypothetical protein
MAGEIQVDAWGAFVPGRGDLFEKIKEGVAKKVSERELPNLEISEGSLDISRDLLDKWFRAGEPRDYLFFVQHLGKTASAMVALRIAKRGTKDLELSWRLLEGNPAKGIFKNVTEGAKIYLGVTIAGAGVLTSIFGFGLAAIPIGAALAGSGIDGLKNNKGARNLTTEQQLDARILTQTVDYCLMSQLEELGVSSDEVRVLQAAQMEGIGRLGNSQ